MSAVSLGARGFIIALIVGVASCGGGGGGDSPSAPAQSKVFAADEVNGGVGSTENANPAVGQQIAITRIIAGSNTQIPQVGGCFGCLPSLALDSGRDQLYVSTIGNILVFNNAGTATGNIAPSRVIGGGAGSGTNRHLQLNAGADILYVSTPTGTIYRFDSASSAGSATIASRTLTVSGLLSNDFVTGMALDTTNDVLYVALNRNGFGSVGIILGISGRVSGSVSLNAEMSVSVPSPTITIDGSRNRLYVGGLSGQVFVFDNASTRTTGPGLISRTIQLPFTPQHRLFLETTNDRLYASAQNRVVILNNAGSATGTVTAAAAQLSTINSDLTAVVARP